MWIMPKRRAGRVGVASWRADGSPGCTNLLRQNDGREWRTDKPGAQDHRRGLIYRSVNLVIGGLRKVRGRDRGDAHYCDQQERNK